MKQHMLHLYNIIKAIANISHIFGTFCEQNPGCTGEILYYVFPCRGHGVFLPPAIM